MEVTQMTKDMKRVLKFAQDYKQWHGFRNDKQTTTAINRLLELRLIEVNKYNQFKIA